MPVWRNGSRGRLKIYFKQLSAGSSPVTGKNEKGEAFLPLFRFCRVRKPPAWLPYRTRIEGDAFRFEKPTEIAGPVATGKARARGRPSCGEAHS